MATAGAAPCSAATGKEAEATEAVVAPPGERSIIERLDGWKSIAAYLDVSVRTVRRWVERCGLPIRTWPGSRSVCVLPAELDDWMAKSLQARADEDGSV